MPLAVSEETVRRPCTALRGQTLDRPDTTSLLRNGDLEIRIHCLVRLYPAVLIQLVSHPRHGRMPRNVRPRLHRSDQR